MSTTDNTVTERQTLESISDRRVAPMQVRSPLDQLNSEIEGDMVSELRQTRAQAKIALFQEQTARSKANLAALTGQFAQPVNNGHPVQALPSTQIPQELVVKLAEMEPEQAERALDYYQKMLAAQAAGNNPSILPYIMGPPKSNGEASDPTKTVLAMADMFKTGATMAKESVPQATQYNPVELMRMGVELANQNRPPPNTEVKKDAKDEMAGWLEVFDKLGFLKKGDEGPATSDTQLQLDIRKWDDERHLRELELQEKYGVEKGKIEADRERTAMWGSVIEDIGGAVGRGFADANLIGGDEAPTQGFPPQQQAPQPVNLPPPDTAELIHRQCSDCYEKNHRTTWIPIPNPAQARQIICPTCGASGDWPGDGTQPQQPPAQQGVSFRMK